MEQVPIVSVLLPVYNDEIYLTESANSILSQTFPFFELIIIDDGSNEVTKAVIEQIHKFDSR